MAQSVVLLSVTEEERKRKLKTDSLGKTQRSESPSPPCLKGEIAVSVRQLVMELIGGVEGLREASLLCMLKATLKFAKEREERRGAVCLVLI